MLGTGWAAMAQAESEGSTTRHSVTRYCGPAVAVGVDGDHALPRGRPLTYRSWSGFMTL